MCVLPVPAERADGTGIVVDVGVDVVQRSSPQVLGYLADRGILVEDVTLLPV